MLLSPESDSSKVGSVILKDASPIECSLIIMGTGVQPATGFLADSGFKLEDDKGIAVDEYLQVEGKQHIYALGDIAHWPEYKSGEKRRIEHWQVAVSLVPILSRSLPLLYTFSVLEQPGTHHRSEHRGA